VKTILDPFSVTKQPRNKQRTWAFSGPNSGVDVTAAAALSLTGMVSDALPSASPAAASAASARRTCTLDDDTTFSAFQLSANTVLSTMALNGQLNGFIRNKRLNQLFR
jgi:hypothetical protein